MEHTLGVRKYHPFNTITRGLNPCFNGTYSRRTAKVSKLTFSLSLNPCFNGTYSRSSNTISLTGEIVVLILVLMEHTLGVKQVSIFNDKNES